jgi:hypothetical protein
MANCCGRVAFGQSLPQHEVGSRFETHEIAALCEVGFLGTLLVFGGLISALSARRQLGDHPSAVSDRDGSTERLTPDIKSSTPLQRANEDGLIHIKFITRAMAPIRFVSDRVAFDDLIRQLSEVMIVHGFVSTPKAECKILSNLGLSARVPNSADAYTLSSGIVVPIFCCSKYCSKELVARPLLHAVMGASRSTPTRIQQMTGLAGNGDGL